jgi:hypothetical protein
MSLNPHTMTAAEIATTATRAQITDAIGRATKGLMTGRNTDGWAALLGKLNAALRIQLTPNRPIAAPALRYRARHASDRAEFAGYDADGLARYAGVHY